MMFLFIRYTIKFHFILSQELNMTRYLFFLIILFSCKKELTKEQLFERDRLELVNELE